MNTWSLNIAYINHLVRFNKAQKIFPSVTRVLSIFLTRVGTCAERVNSKERVPKVPCSIPAASYAQRWALYSKNKKSKLCFTTCKNRLSVYVDEERLESFMKKVPIIQKPVHWTNQWTGFYTTKTSVTIELTLCYLHVFTEIYSLIMTK